MATIRVPGFQFAGVACGIKKSKKKDLALIFSERPAAAAALFTTNRVKAGSVLVGMQNVRRGRIQAVVIASGNANACTGKRGLRDAETMCQETARRLGIDPTLVLPSCTGLIGVPLPMANVRAGIAKAATALAPDSFLQAAEAITTTDRFVKVSATSSALGSRRVTVAGMVKGAGMIAPNMATMLAYVLTDAAVEPRCLRSILRRTADVTFNAVTVDGDMSTNDTVLFLANGVAGNRPVTLGSREERALLRAVTGVMQELAVKLVEDGEGTTKVVEIRVERAKSVDEAKKVAFSVANSKLVKIAFYGADPNFGRIMMAIGYAGIPIDPDRINVAFDGVRVVRKGIGLPTSERQAAHVLKKPSFRVTIDLAQGRESFSVWTSDLSHEYVRINSAYRT